LLLSYVTFFVGYWFVRGCFVVPRRQDCHVLPWGRVVN